VGYPSGQGDNSNQRISKSFFWANTLKVGSGEPKTLGGAYTDRANNCPKPPVENTDYFNRAPREGDPDYPYVPYQYPHPLVSGEIPIPPEPEPEPQPPEFVTKLFSPEPQVMMQDDSKSVELSTQFSSSVNGKVIAIRFYKGGIDNSGPHSGSLWNADGVRLANVLFDNETEGGWQEASLPEPVQIEAGKTYTVSYHAPNGHYSLTQDFYTVPFVNGPLTAFKAAYLYGNDSAYPTTIVMRSYFVDVVFQT
jgi:hypothetical protein